MKLKTNMLLAICGLLTASCEGDSKNKPHRPVTSADSCVAVDGDMLEIEHIMLCMRKLCLYLAEFNRYQ